MPSTTSGTTPGRRSCRSTTAASTGIGDNISEYDNPTVNRLIDRALAEPDRDRRAAMWAEIDQRIMRDAPMVPLVWENYSFQWASRVHGWVYDPWTTGPDLTAVVAGPAEPLTAASARGGPAPTAGATSPVSLPTAPA